MRGETLQTLLARAREALFKGRTEEAARLAAAARAQAPAEPEAWYLEGAATLGRGRVHEALPLMQTALRLSPAHPECLLYLGLALSYLKRFSEAEPLLRKLLSLRPGNAEAWQALGGVLLELGKREEALVAHRKAAALKPNDPVPLCRLGRCEALAGDHEAALASYRRALALQPSLPEALHGAGMESQRLHRIPEALQAYERLLATKPANPSLLSHRLLALHYGSGLSADKLYEEHLAYGRLLESPERLAENAARAFPNSTDPEKRLRVGLLSPDLRIHSVAFFLQPLLEHLDRARFEVFLYHDNPKEDAFTKLLGLGAACLRRTAGMTDAQVEETIRRDAPDLLLDLCGHTDRNRLPLFARRLAPLQLSYLGYPDTTGLRSMDYRLTDALADPEGEAERFYTEKLLRFSPCAWCFWPPPGAPEPAARDTASGGGLRFGCFNSFSKLSDATLDLWGALLSGIPKAELLLKSLHPAASGFLERLESQGLPKERVRLLPSSPDAISHLQAYAEIDIALDPFPYNGTTTTCEALWMGVPVLSLRGDRHSARVGASLLSAVGHPEWIADSTDAFLQKARALADDRATLARLRGGLRDELRRSILLDASGQSERFGAALRTVWREWCQKRV